MVVYYQPVNPKMWNMLEEISGEGIIEAFYATKEMKPGDMMLFHVGCQDKRYESGIYAYGIVVSTPYIYKKKKEDYCYGKLSVDVKFDKIVYNSPLMHHEECKKYIKNYRVPNKLKDDTIYEILKTRP